MIRRISSAFFALFCLVWLTGAGWLPLVKSPPPGGWCTLIPQSGLVNCWPYDTANTTSGTATDVIGGKNSTQTNVTLSGSGPSTNLNNAIVCNGTTSQGNTPGPASSTPPPRSAFSVVYWIFPVSAAGSPSVIANDNTAGADNNGIRFFYNTASTLMQEFAGNGTTSAQVSSGGVGSLPINTWNMLTVTYDGATMTGYKGASSTGTASLAGPVAAPTNALGFCYNPASVADFFQGRIAGVAIYNRALNSGEVTTINGL